MYIKLVGELEITCENMINQSIHQIMVVSIVTFKQFKRSLIEAYINVERRVKLNNKTPFYWEILIVFADNNGLINYYK